MHQMKKMKNCKHFKGMDYDIHAPFRHSQDHNCKQCVYFSSRNCGMDVSDTIEPGIDQFG